MSHLSVRGQPAPEAGRRAPRGTGSKIQVRPGVWKFTVTAGRYADGGVRRLHRTVQAHTEAEATLALAAFVAEVRRDRLPEHRRDREITVDEAIDQFLRSTDGTTGNGDRRSGTACRQGTGVAGDGCRQGTPVRLGGSCSHPAASSTTDV
jgi:hypothetical protein